HPPRRPPARLSPVHHRARGSAVGGRGLHPREPGDPLTRGNRRPRAAHQRRRRGRGPPGHDPARFQRRAAKLLLARRQVGRHQAAAGRRRVRARADRGVVREPLCAVQGAQGDPTAAPADCRAAAHQRAVVPEPAVPGPPRPPHGQAGGLPQADGGRRLHRPGGHPRRQVAHAAGE
ncbi:hypothetical protein BN1708_018911, partial [Verticillium longisporum]